jgi:hypothetical protein
MQMVALDTIAGGALPELFAEELGRVLANIADPNTDTTARAITITIAFKPNRDRDAADVTVTCASKLAGTLHVETKVFMGKQHGKWIAVENDPRQSNLFDQERPLTPVAAFQKPESAE